MRRLRYLDGAKRDFLDILTYIATESGDVALARAFVGTLQAQCRKLATLPGTIGRPRPELHPGIRSFAFRGYVIFFRYADDVLEVIDIVERHRDIGDVFDEI